MFLMRMKLFDDSWFLLFMGSGLMFAVVAYMFTIGPLGSKEPPIQITIESSDLGEPHGSTVSSPAPQITVQCVTEPSSIEEDPDLKRIYEHQRSIQDLELEVMVGDAYQDFLESHLDDCRQSLDEKCDYDGMYGAP
jgi:hypothetical protein